MNISDKAVAVLTSLRPNGWVITEGDFDSIRYDDGIVPITKTEWADALKTIEATLTTEAAAAATAKAALLARLGITADEAKLLLG